MLQVEEQRGDDLVHVLRVPDVGLELVVHRLPHHSLQAFNAGHPDPGEQTDAQMLRIYTAYVILHLYTQIYMGETARSWRQGTNLVWLWEVSVLCGFPIFPPSQTLHPRG